MHHIFNGFFGVVVEFDWSPVICLYLVLCLDIDIWIMNYSILLLNLDAR